MKRLMLCLSMLALCSSCTTSAVKLDKPRRMLFVECYSPTLPVGAYAQDATVNVRQLLGDKIADELGVEQTHGVLLIGVDRD